MNLFFYVSKTYQLFWFPNKEYELCKVKCFRMFKSPTSFTLNNQYNAHTATIKKLGISMCIDNLNAFAVY